MKKLFNEYQPVLLQLANNPYFQKQLEICHVPEGKKIVNVFPNGVTYSKGDYLYWLFWGHDVIARALYENLGDVYQFSKLKLPNAFEYMNRYRYAWLNNPFYTGAGDGYLGEAIGTWAGARNATSSNQGNDYTSTTLRLSGIYNGSNYFIYRGRLPFNTAALGSGATLTSGTLMLNNSSIEGSPYNESGGYWLVNVASALASFTTLTDNDYDNFGTTKHIDSAFPSDTTGSNTIALNATGLAAVSLTSYTDWGLLTNRDQANSSPGGTGGQQLFVSTVEDSTVGNRPLLTIVTPSRSGFFAVL